MDESHDHASPASHPLFIFFPPHLCVFTPFPFVPTVLLLLPLFLITIQHTGHNRHHHLPATNNQHNIPGASKGKSSLSGCCVLTPLYLKAGTRNNQRLYPSINAPRFIFLIIQLDWINEPAKAHLQLPLEAGGTGFQREPRGPFWVSSRLGFKTGGSPHTTFLFCWTTRKGCLFFVGVYRC